MDKNTCKKLDIILDSMRREEKGCIFDFRKFYSENFIKEYSMYPQTYDPDINYLKSKLVEDGQAEHIGSNKNSLRIKVKGIVYPGYCKERIKAIKSRLWKITKWISLIMIIIAGIITSIFYAIGIFDLCKCYLEK